MAKEENWVYIVIGALVGIPLGMVLYKYLFGDKTVAPATASQTAYGFNYVYDQDGNLTSYTPVPLGSAPITVQKTEAKPEQPSSSIEGLLLP